MKDKEHHETDDLILGRFIKQRLLESYQEYKTYLIRDIFGGERAEIKIQPQSEVRPTVLHEAGFLQQMQGYPGFPLMIWSGNFSKEDMGLITQKLGYNLEELRLVTASKRFQLPTVCFIGLQILKIIETLHDKHTVLEFISPQTFRLNPSRIDQLLISSLFHCKRYRSYKNLQLYKIKKAEKIDFVNHFMSRNKLESFTTSRRDDLQSFFYLLVYLLKGKLPWSHLSVESNEQTINNLIKMQKSILNQYSEIREDLLKGLPSEFIAIFEHISGLAFEEKPNYSSMRLKLSKLMTTRSNHQQLVPQWVRYVPKMRQQSIGTQPIDLLTIKDRNLLQKFYQPYQQKIQIDHFNGRADNHSQQQNNQNGFRSLKRVRRSKNHCQLI